MSQVEPPDRLARQPSRLETAGLRCPICGALTRRLFHKHGYWIRGCIDCGHRCAEIVITPDHATRVYDDAYFNGGGAGYPDYTAEAGLLRDRGRWYGELLRQHMPTGSVLDVGAAAGCILEGLMECGWVGAAVEPNRRMAAHLHERLGVDVHVGCIEEFDAAAPFDLVAMIQVIGHFWDLRKALDAAARATAARGFWLIETWDRESAIAQLLGRHWHEYNPPTVLQWFSARGLERLALQYGFRQVARGRPKKRLNGAHAKSLLLYALRNMPGAAVAGRTLGLVPDDMTIPYSASDVFWALFQHASTSSAVHGLAYRPPRRDDGQR